jgi:hypothetical protein
MLFMETGKCLMKTLVVPVQFFVLPMEFRCLLSKGFAMLQKAGFQTGVPFLEFFILLADKGRKSPVLHGEVIAS